VAVAHAIYEWEAWGQFMLPAVVPGAVRVRALPDEGAAEVLRRLPDGVASFSFHINCSVTRHFPHGRAALVQALLERGLRVFNPDVVDIRKGSLQARCRQLGLATATVDAQDGAERVIIKTDANYGGLGERRLGARARQRLGVPEPSAVIAGADGYRVLPRREVPEAWWSDRSLAIERFVENRDGRYFRVYFVGEQLVFSDRIHRDAIKKYRGSERRDSLVGRAELRRGLPGVPESVTRALDRFLTGLGADFGSVDVVMDDEERAYVIDFNATPFFRAHPGYVEHLQRGFDGLLAGPTNPVAVFVHGVLARRPRLQPEAAPARPRPAKMPALRYRGAGDLAVITSYFNPEGFASRLRNFDWFAAPFRGSGPRLFTVECAFGEAPHSLGGDDPVRSRSVLWQKERLLNVALSRLPPRFTKVAWIDCDVLFENPDWAVETARLLDTYQVVQPFDTVVRLPRGHHADDGSGRRWDGFAAVLAQHPNAVAQGDFGVHGHTGFAWAARREVLDGIGLYDACIVGGGDHLMAHGFAGEWDSACLFNVTGGNERHRAHALDWCERIYRRVRARIARIPGRVLHLWHGEIETRSYQDRHALLARHDYDPAADIRVGDGGAWEWSGTKPDLERAVRSYFAGRLEDDG
jgi:hypothetical protein